MLLAIVEAQVASAGGDLTLSPRPERRKRIVHVKPRAQDRGERFLEPDGIPGCVDVGIVLEVVTAALDANFLSCQQVRSTWPQVRLVDIPPPRLSLVDGVPERVVIGEEQNVLREGKYCEARV